MTRKIISKATASARHWKLNSKRIGCLLAILGVWAIATIILAYRNPAPFALPNFYAEDATIFVNNILLHPLTAVTTLFNGYLVVGQYLVGYLAVFIAMVTGNGVASIPLCIAAVSTAFLGLCISLPFILFRRQLGTWLALAAVLVGAFVPLYSMGYAVIGTIGNLKFVFIYVAFLLILYRNLHIRTYRRLYLIDGLLLLCVLTNIFALILLPFAFWPYRQFLFDAIRKRTVKECLQNRGLLSAIVLAIVSLLYTIVVYAKGIPVLTGYLDQPYQSGATLPLLDRATTYAWLYPITNTFHGRIVLLVLGLTLVGWWLSRKRDHFVIVFGLWAIGAMTVLFVANRTGVSALYLDFAHKGGADQFFYAQNLIFIFLPFWLMRESFQSAKLTTRVFIVLALAAYLAWALPFGTDRSGGERLYQGQGTSYNRVEQACRSNSSQVTVHVYPAAIWLWSAPRAEVCQGIRL